MLRSIECEILHHVVQLCAEFYNVDFLCPFFRLHCLKSVISSREEPLDLLYHALTPSNVP